MSSVIVAGNVSGSVTLDAPAVSGSTVITLPTTSGTMITTASTDTVNNLNAGIGVNQTWTNVVGSRALNTNYTNSTGKPITVFVTANCGASNIAGLFAVVGGVALGPSSSSNAGQAQMTFIVPNGAIYAAQINSGAPTLTYWTELR